MTCPHCKTDDVVGPFEMDGYDNGKYLAHGLWWIVCRACGRTSKVTSSMQTWTKEIGTTWTQGTGTVNVTGDAAQLRAWAHRNGNTWPCSTLAKCDRVTVTLDPHGDLVDLLMPNGNLDGSEMTAWIDDNLAGTPFAHLQRGPVTS